MENSNKKILLLGSACADITIRVDHLPTLEEDVNPLSQKISLGGCACNVSNMLQLFQVPYETAFVTGTGIYGEFVEKALNKRGITPMFHAEEENGSCITLVDSDGNRTFLSVHGAEYKYKKEWLERLDSSLYSGVYVCGIDLEESCNDCILDWLEKTALKIYFAPGPRIGLLQAERLKRITSLHPILHLNKREAKVYLSRFHIETNEPLSKALYKIIRNTVIITDGANGCEAYDGNKLYHVPAVKSRQVDGTGAGDSHIGTILACKARGIDLESALKAASIVSAKVVSVPGPTINEKEFQEIVSLL